MSSRLTSIFNIDVVRLGLTCSVLFFGACATASEEEKLRSERQGVYAQMSEIVGDNSCSTVTDCSILPVGSMACGGPANYMAYAVSIGKDKVSQLKALSERSKQLDKKLNQLSQRMSTCVFRSPPSLICESNQCSTTYEPGGPIGIKTDVE